MGVQRVKNDKFSCAKQSENKENKEHREENL